MLWEHGNVKNVKVKPHLVSFLIQNSQTVRKELVGFWRNHVQWHSIKKKMHKTFVILSKKYTDYGRTFKNTVCIEQT